MRANLIPFDFISLIIFDGLSGAPSLIRGFFPEVKWLGSETNQSPPPSVEVKNDGAIPPLPLMSPWRGA
jgi:hypothetical protein